MLRMTFPALAIWIAMSSVAMAQKNGPIIIPEEVQELATKIPVAQRLGIKWGAASPEQIGRYMSLLAAVSILAMRIAQENDRKLPSVSDDLAAFAAMCLFPPNKPPLAEPYWARASAAFDNQKVREALQAGVGPLAIRLPKEIAAGRGKETVLTTWPKTNELYFQKVLNLGLLSNGK